MAELQCLVFSVLWFTNRLKRRLSPKQISQANCRRPLQRSPPGRLSTKRLDRVPGPVQKKLRRSSLQWLPNLKIVCRQLRLVPLLQRRQRADWATSSTIWLLTSRRLSPRLPTWTRSRRKWTPQSTNGEQRCPQSKETWTPHRLPQDQQLLSLLSNVLPTKKPAMPRQQQRKRTKSLHQLCRA